MPREEDRGLIRIPAEGGRPLRFVLAGALFLVLCVGTAVVDRVRPAPEAQPIGLERIELRKLQIGATWWNGKQTKLIEKKLARTSRVRTWVAPSWALAMYAWLGSGRREVRIGPGKWLFVEERLVPSHLPAERIVGEAAALLATVERGLAARGSRLVFLPVPRKEDLHAEHLPRGARVRPELLPALYGALAQRGIETVDLREPFAKLGDSPVYDRVDSHWTGSAEYVAARACARQSGRLVPPAERLGTYVPGPPARRGIDLLTMLGIPADLARARELADPVPTYVFVPTPDNARSRDELVKRDADVALVGTSFSKDRQVDQFLAHFLGEPVFNAARIGGDPMVPLRDLLRLPRQRGLVVLEIPVHALVAPRPLATVGDLLSELRMDAAPAIVPRGALDLSAARLGEVVPLGPHRRLVQARSRRVTHSGDGVVAWRLAGEVTGEDVVVVLQGADRRITQPWPAGQRELFLPLIAANVTREVGALVVRPADGAAPGPRSLRLDELDLVAFVAGESARELPLGECAALVGEAGAYRQRTAASPQAPVPAGAVLVLDADEECAESTLVVRAVAGGRDVQWSGPIAPGGAFVLSLDALAGETLAEVMCTWRGVDPGRGFARARLFGAVAP